MIAVGAALLIMLAGLLCRTDVYGAFLRGAQQGMETAKSILPALCAALWMTACLRGSGALEELARAAGPLLSAMGIPAELLPFLAVRPVSGAAAPRLPHGCRNDELVGNRFVCAGALSGSGKTARTTLAVALRTGFHGGRNGRIGAVHPLKKKRRCAAVSLKTEGLEAFLKRKRARNLQNLPILLPDAVFVV